MPYDYLSAPPDSLDCPICRQPLISPVLPPECMHVFCSTCLTRSLSISPTCPIDRRPVLCETVRPAPLVIQSLLDDLLVQCNECTWRGRREAYDTHDCPPSQQEVVKETCGYCNAELEGPLPAHLLSCGEVPSPCRYALYGCEVRLKRDQLSSHACRYEGLQGLFSRLEDRFTGLEEENTFLKAKIDSMQFELDNTRKDKSELTDRLDKMQQDMQEVLQAVSTLEIKGEMQIMSESMRLQEELQVVKAALQYVLPFQTKMTLMVLQSNENADLAIDVGEREESGSGE